MTTEMIALKTQHLLAGAFIAGVVLAYMFTRVRRYAFQNDGEARVTTRLLASFRFPDYHLLNHITLKHGDGSTQIDHILLSRFGVFVIETKAHKGWLFASVDQRSWTQVLFGEKFKLRNPIKQNQLHVRVVRELLDFLPADVIRSAVVFAGTSEFKTKQPDGVFDIDQLIAHIRSFREEVISLNRMQFCVGRIETSRYAITKETDIDHVDSLRSRYGITDR